MANTIIFLIYFGGIQAVPDDFGFWATMFWPYYLGKYAAQFAVRAKAIAGERE